MAVCHISTFRLVLSMAIFDACKQSPYDSWSCVLHPVRQLGLRSIMHPTRQQQQDMSHRLELGVSMNLRLQ
jgi:hypothetical protein